MLRELKLLQKDSPDARLKVVTLPEVYFPLVRGEQANLGGILRVKPSRRNVVYANVMQMDRYLPGILDIIHGNVTAEQAIEKVENPPD